MKVLFFSPHAGIWSHAFPEAVIAESLKNNGHEIKYITCEQSFQGYCTVMAAFGLPNEASAAEKNNVCKTCNKYNRLLLDEFKFDHDTVKNNLDSNEIENIEKKLSLLNHLNFLDFEIEGIEIGRLTLYQMLLEYKKNTLRFSESEWKRFLIDLKNALMVFYSLKKVFIKYKPDIAIVYNSLYSVNHIFCKLAQRFQVKQYFLHTGGNLATRAETMILAQGDGFIYYQHLLKRWHDFKHIPCSDRLISKVKDHLLSVIQGTTVFSYSTGVSPEQVNLREYFNIKDDQKIILATLSSNDERFAATIVKAFTQSDTVLFANQFDWLKCVIEYVENRPDLCLIIRVHPREMPNKRESVVSENYNQLQNIFSNLPSNVKINWPSDKISLYYLAQEIDLCLNSWSSAGKELAALGIPVLLYSEEIQVYPADLNYLGESKEEYFQLFEEALRMGWSFDRIIKVFRWYAFEYFRTTLDLSDSFSVKKITFASKVYKKCLRMIDNAALQKIDFKKRSRNLAAGSIINRILSEKSDSILDVLKEEDMETDSVENETRNITKHLKEVFNVMHCNKSTTSSLLRKFNNYMKAFSSTCEIE